MSDANNFGDDLDEFESVRTMRIGEIGKDNAHIQQRLIDFAIEYTIGGETQLRFSVYDPGLRMHEAGYFILGRRVQWGGVVWEMSNVKVIFTSDPSVVITCKIKSTMRLKRQKGAAEFGTIGPHVFAAQRAGSVGLSSVAQPAPADEPIVRRQEDNVDESSYDVMASLAGSLEYTFAIIDNVMFFATDEKIMDTQPTVSVHLPSRTSDTLQVVRADLIRSEDENYPRTLDMQLRRDSASVRLRPGMGINVGGITHFDEQKFMIATMNYTGSPSQPVRITARVPAKRLVPEQVDCTKKFLQRGSKGTCVRRVQSQLGVPAHGNFDTVTEYAVERFQIAQGIPPWLIEPHGTVGARTWRALENA